MIRSRLGMSAYYQKKEGGGQDLSRSHLARGDRVLIRVNVGSCCKIAEGQPSLQGLSLLTFTKRLEAGLIFSVAANLDGHDLPKTSLGLHR